MEKIIKCTISLEEETGSITSLLLYRTFFIDTFGADLLNVYNNKSKVEELMTLNDFSDTILCRTKKKEIVVDKTKFLNKEEYFLNGQSNYFDFIFLNNYKEWYLVWENNTFVNLEKLIRKIEVNTQNDIDIPIDLLYKEIVEEDKKEKEVKELYEKTIQLIDIKEQNIKKVKI